MDHVAFLPESRMGREFIPPELIPEGKDEYYLRDQQIPWPRDRWRHLTSNEIEQLVTNQNMSDNWDDVLVTDHFEPQQIRNTSFFGLVRIGKIPRGLLEHHDLQAPVGITNSLIIACDIGDEVAIHNVKYLAHYIIGDRCILLNVNEMHATNHAKFGNGTVKVGEEENVRTWLEVMNETGSRKILPFDGIITADAYLWAKYRDDSAMQEKLLAITEEVFDTRRGFYGTVGNQSVIKSSLILKDVKIGSHCYINGANKLKNLTINSSPEESTHIGEGVELVNGIIGYGCHIFYGVKAVRFVLGDNSHVKYGARLIHSVLGDNSTLSCCEMLNNLIFPSHEQHHSNSFLIASVVLGQSNVAAGATIGSNHNSRSNDNEVQAGRGFWPGLCSSIKHSCRFVSFVLLSKGDYPAEMDIPLPFSLLNNNVPDNRLEILPGYWWLYNMYALARNMWKFQNRDQRMRKVQHLEFDSLAPDTIEEMFHARRLLEIWTAQAYLRKQETAAEVKSQDNLTQIGRALLSGEGKVVDQLEVLGENMERSDRKVLILKVRKGYQAYHDMMFYYAVKNLMDFVDAHPGAGFAAMGGMLGHKRLEKWVNLGGQLMPERDVDRIRADIGSGKLKNWDGIHDRYEALWRQYPLEKQKHAYGTLCSLLATDALDLDQWKAALGRVVKIQEFVRDQVCISRKKDFDNHFHQITYRNQEEMDAAIGTVEENSFVQQVRVETEAFRKRADDLKNQR